MVPVIRSKTPETRQYGLSEEDASQLAIQRGQSYDSGMHGLTIFLQALVAASIFFVWVVRYDNVIEEFKVYGLPDWLRDLVGILKLTFSLMLLIGIEREAIAMAGGLGIAVLLGCAVFTHLRLKNSLSKMLPSLTLLFLSIVIASINYRLLKGQC